jgi:hypothetical protein
LGYSVVLWEIPEYGLEDGEIVQVYFKSNITHTYAIGLPPEGKQKAEIPLWQLSAPDSRRNAEGLRDRFGDYRNVYALVALDGLPVRSEPVNTARQVYRLKKDEAVKVLYKGAGQPVMIGSESAEGDWLRIMTGDGTQGWCFSYNLRLFNTRRETPEDAAPERPRTDRVLEAVIAARWYPEFYGGLIAAGTVDLERVRSDYGFFIDPEHKTVRINLPDLAQESPYREIESEGDAYLFAGSAFSFIPRAAPGGEIGLIVVTVTDERGMPRANNFVTLSEPIEDTIAAEVQRRRALFAALEGAGPVFSSEHYGTIRFSAGAHFTWADYRLLSPAIIPARAGDGGTVEFKYFLAKDFPGSFDGVITLRFSGQGGFKPGEINFFYKIEDDGLRLEDASGAASRNNVFSARGNSPVVAFFAGR